MAELLALLLWLFARATLLLAIAFVLTKLLLRTVNVRSARFHMLTWLTVVAQGLMLLPYNVEWKVFDDPSARATTTAGPTMSAQPRGSTQRDSSATVAVRVSRNEPDFSMRDSESVSQISGPPTQAVVAAANTLTGWPSPVAIIAGIWLFGVVVSAAWLVTGYFRFLQPVLKASSEDAAVNSGTAKWQSECDFVRREIGFRPAVTIALTEDDGPAVCWVPSGYRMLVPAGRWERLTAADREMVLYHELAHLRRGDLWTIAGCSLIACLHWFNPLSWLAVWRVAECTEWACDEFVRRSCRQPATHYARLLLELATASGAVPRLIPSAAGHSLVRRTERLLNPGFKEDSLMKKLTILSVATMLAVAGAVNVRLTAQETEGDLPQTSATAPFEAPSADAPSTAAAKPIDAVDSGSADQATPIMRQSSSTLAVVPDLTDAAALKLLQPADGSPTRPTSTEAVIDVTYVINHLPEFESQRRDRQKQMRTHHEKLRAESQLMHTMKAQVAAASPVEREKLLVEVAEREARLRIERDSARQRLTLAEARAHAAAFRRVRDAIAAYARENGIQIVRRARIGREQQARLDSDDPQAIIQAMNEPVLYIADEGMDITDAVLERLKAESQADGSE
ncbi:MAG: M56 family metallopeptidase [Planctomycetaceae bacterium]